MNPIKLWCSEHTNPQGVKGSIRKALSGSDVFIGLSGAGVVTNREINRMARNAVVFAMANPTPEIMPEKVGPHVRVIATGRSDYPNQINNVLCFPGMFRGILDARARVVNDRMKIAAARGIASIVSRSDLSEDYIIPSVFDRRVVEVVAEEIVKAAHETGVARRSRVGKKSTG